MSEIPPPEPEPEEEAGPSLPSWVPVLIGGVLVALAALAVFTGLRYRQNPVVSVVRPHRTSSQAATPAPPGEPQAGASLIFSGAEAPNANPAVEGQSRATLSGTGTAVESNVRIWARRGMTTKIVPEDAVVYVNDVAVGQAKQLATQVYEFAQPGSYTVRVTAPGYRDRVYTVTADESAKAEIARIDSRLTKQ
jgi:hypothetical protein